MMENLKVKVNNEAESKEVQELFFELGYKFSMVDFCKYYNSVQVFDDGSGSLFEDHDTCSHKELTIPQLRDLVVLKRNDVNDATHIDDYNDKWLVNSLGSFNWCDANWTDKTIDVLGYALKPIEKKTTETEYLMQGKNGEFFDEQELDINTATGQNIDIFGAYQGFRKRYIDEPDQEYRKKLLMFSRSRLESPNNQHAEIEKVYRNQKTIDTIHEAEGILGEKHSHYRKSVKHLDFIDPYRIAQLYDLHPCADHIAKKALCTGKRGHKDLMRDIQDIIDTAERWKQMIQEDQNAI